MCEGLGGVRSLSRKSHSPDNAVCEGLFGRMKVEMFRGRDWSGAAWEDLEAEVARYIGWYNSGRLKMFPGEGYDTIDGRRARLGLAAWSRPRKCPDLRRGIARFFETSDRKCSKIVSYTTSRRPNRGIARLFETAAVNRSATSLVWTKQAPPAPLQLPIRRPLRVRPRLERQQILASAGPRQLRCPITVRDAVSPGARAAARAPGLRLRCVRMDRRSGAPPCETRESFSVWPISESSHLVTSKAPARQGTARTFVHHRKNGPRSRQQQSARPARAEPGA